MLKLDETKKMLVVHWDQEIAAKYQITMTLKEP